MEGGMNGGQITLAADQAITAEELLARAEHHLAVVRMTHRLLNDRDRLFGDPPWTLLLEMLVLTLRGEPIVQAALGVDQAIPTTTVERYLLVLEDKGLIECALDLEDRRRKRIWLTPKAREGLVTLMAMRLNL